MATRKIKRPLRIVKRGRLVVGRRRKNTSTVLKRHGTKNAQGNPIEPILAGRKSCQMGRHARLSRREKKSDGSPLSMVIPEKDRGKTKIHGYQQEPAGIDIDRYAAGE